MRVALFGRRRSVGSGASASGCGVIIVGFFVLAAIGAVAANPPLLILVGIVAALVIAKKVFDRRAQEEMTARSEAYAREAAARSEAHAREAARSRLFDLDRRFGPQAAEAIFLGRIWYGQTMEMLVESLGRPVVVDDKGLKTKTRHVFKYAPTGVNRFALKVTLDNGIVQAWDDSRGLPLPIVDFTALRPPPGLPPLPPPTYRG